MALIDSENAFKERCDRLDPQLFDLLKAQDIQSFSSLGFAVGSPQAPVEEAEFTAFSNKVFGAGATLGSTSKLRRLHFESVTFYLADLQNQVTSTELTEPSRRLPFVEKQARLESQKSRITGLLHRPEQQPSHSLIDSVFSMVESGSLLYIPPSKCYSREQEVQSESKQKTKHLVTLEAGSLKTSSTNNMSDVDTSSELRVFFALQRRHLAFELVGLLSWEMCQQWLDKLMTSLLADPHSTSHAVSLTQILKADRQMFSFLAAEHSGSLKAAPKEKPPLDEIFRRLMHDPRINVHLIAYQKLGGHSGDNKAAQPAKRPSDQRNDNNRSPKKARGSPTKPHPQMPTELVGLHTKSSDNKPICWHRNLKKGCNNAVKSNRCRFGMHICMKCLKSGHGAFECPN